jgi:hypothetical protein
MAHLEEAVDVRSVDFLGDSTPASSTNRKCIRDTTRLRWLPMSMFRLASRRNTSLCPTAATRRRSGERSAATATDNASFGSFLFDRPVANNRARDASVAGTSTTVSPAATSCWASR